jgi:hypothetical protein
VSSCRGEEWSGRSSKKFFISVFFLFCFKKKFLCQFQILPFSGETEIHGTEILLKEEILDAKIAKFLSVRRPNKNHYCSSHFYTGENERNLFQPNFLMIPLE